MEEFLNEYGVDTGKMSFFKRWMSWKATEKKKKEKKNNIDLVILQKRSYSTLKG